MEHEVFDDIWRQKDCTPAKVQATGESEVRRIEDVDGTPLTYAEVKAIASGSPMVIEKARKKLSAFRFDNI